MPELEYVPSYEKYPRSHCSDDNESCRQRSRTISSEQVLASTISSPPSEGSFSTSKTFVANKNIFVSTLPSPSSSSSSTSISASAVAVDPYDLLTYDQVFGIVPRGVLARW